jgi:hypothetical protein
MHALRLRREAAPYSQVTGTRKMKCSLILIVPEDIWQNTL